MLFFSQQPNRFFDRTWIELVWHQDEVGRQFKEIYFKGPLHQQLRQALAFIKNNILSEQVVKVANSEKSERYFNYPYPAIEEVLSNAVYHKSYELGSPIEIQVFKDKMTVLSYPGPVPPVNAEILKNHKRIIAREYRNRRIGDFLKELGLTEGRGTGFPLVYEAMEENQSPQPSFETDELHYVLVTLPIKADFSINDQAYDQAHDQAHQVLKDKVHDKVEDLLLVAGSWKTKSELLEEIELKKHSDNRIKYITPLIDIGWLAMCYPDTPTHPQQGYRITESGKRILALLQTGKNG